MSDETGRLLVVDDNEMNRDMLSRRLTRVGHSVETAVDGEEALARLATEPFDLVLLDVMMPGIDGLKVLETLRETRTLGDLPVIMVTAREESAEIVQALELGANDYITKPVDFAVAQARVNTQLRLKRLAELKDEFLRIASHDLRNPLTAVLSTASVMNATLEPGETVTEETSRLLKGIHRYGRVMLSIIEDFLEFQAMEDGRMEITRQSLDPLPILAEAVETNRTYAEGKGIELVFEPGEESGVILGDAARLSQVAQNLVNNALKFSPPGTRVTVRAAADGDWARFEVRDQGPGFTDGDLAKVFGRYARLSNKPTAGEKSSGLGLAICKQLVELQGGEIGVANNPDKGATLWVRLPRAQEQDA